jgi:hypothetical protein
MTPKIYSRLICLALGHGHLIGLSARTSRNAGRLLDIASYLLARCDRETGKKVGGGRWSRLLN